MAHGATLTVTNTNTNDSGAGSLRQAIADANAGDNVTISGLMIKDGNATGDGGGGILSWAVVTLVDTTITSNRVDSSSGGGIANHGTLVLTGSTLDSNQADLGVGFGGGIYNGLSGTATVSNSIISAYGGGASTTSTSPQTTA